MIPYIKYCLKRISVKLFFIDLFIAVWYNILSDKRG